jgi:hypothetical protein
MMVQMDDAQLADVHGQAFVITVGEREFNFKGIEGRDFEAIAARLQVFGQLKGTMVARNGSRFVFQSILNALDEVSPIEFPHPTFRIGG